MIDYGPTRDPGVDSVTVLVPNVLRTAGEVDVICSVNGHLANVVRLRFGT